MYHETCGTSVLLPSDMPLVWGSIHIGAKSAGPGLYAAYGSPVVWPYPVRVTRGLRVGFAVGGTANRPCLKVFGVRFGPALWMPLRNQSIPPGTAPLVVPRVVPKNQLMAPVVATMLSTSVGRSKYGGMRETPKVCSA